MGVEIDMGMAGVIVRLDGALGLILSRIVESILQVENVVWTDETIAMIGAMIAVMIGGTIDRREEWLS